MILEQARELGIALANSDEFIRMKQAQKALEQNEAVFSLTRELEEKRLRLVSFFTGDDSDSADAIELTNDIERLQGQLQENPLFLAYVKTESDFSSLITAVDKEINACIEADEQVTVSCSGNCSVCGGCKH